MPFTLRCDKCGNERELNVDSKREENDIEMWSQHSFDIGIECWKCSNEANVSA